jgi:hypothetical protein
VPGDWVGLGFDRLRPLHHRAQRGPRAVFVDHSGGRAREQRVRERRLVLRGERPGPGSDGRLTRSRRRRRASAATRASDYSRDDLAQAQDHRQRHRPSTPSDARRRRRSPGRGNRSASPRITPASRYEGGDSRVRWTTGSCRRWPPPTARRDSNGAWSESMWAHDAQLALTGPTPTRESSLHWRAGRRRCSPSNPSYRPREPRRCRTDPRRRP